MTDESKRVWHVEIRRDEESGPVFYVVHVREAEPGSPMSKSRHVQAVDSVRDMLMNLRDPEITAKVMFGGWDAIGQQEAADLLANEQGTRIVAKVTASATELLSALSLLKVS